MTGERGKEGGRGMGDVMEIRGKIMWGIKFELLGLLLDRFCVCFACNECDKGVCAGSVCVCVGE
ncbi:unnamed protein product [Ilex paraguariensis]|uniref:Uncharacterized protein n=1 Tax=Ilex paraguariensis TaxID=185542 RepID=A0ABC8UL31_9AQUA